MAGKKDTANYEPIKKLGKFLKAHKAKVTVIEYDGGHTLPEKNLENVLTSVIPK